VTEQEAQEVIAVREWIEDGIRGIPGPDGLPPSPQEQDRRRERLLQITGEALLVREAECYLRAQEEP
jgi:hypothetical protein